MSLLSIQEIEAQSIQDVWKKYEQFVNPAQVNLIGSFGFGRELAEKAEGPYIYTKSGRKILDFTCGIGVLTHGHNHPRILAARKRFQELNRMEVHKNFFSPYIAGLGHNIAELLPKDLNMSYFPNSGAEAVEGAIKMAYKYHDGKRKHILHADVSFHGKLMGAASVTGSPEIDFVFPRIPNTHPFEFSNLEAVQEKVERLRNDGGIYAIIVEPFSGSCMQACSNEFLLGLRKICDKENIVLIFDEVYSGWARTGKLFYFMHVPGLVPDILTMGKTFGGGKASISGYVARRPIFMQAYGNLNDATLHSTTYYGFGEETATAIEAINILIEDKYCDRAVNVYEILYPGLMRLKEKYPDAIQNVSGVGAMLGITFNTESSIIDRVAKFVPGKFFKDKRFGQKLITGGVISYLFEKHGILTFFGSNREIKLVVSPTLVTTNEQLEYFLTSLDDTLSKGLNYLVFDFAKTKYFG